MKRTVLLAAVGDVNSPATWSGIPFHFLQAARGAGLINQGLALSASGRDWRIRRLAWNARSVLRGDHHGGYQYSPGFLERLWERDRRRLGGSVIVNCFQLFPDSIVLDSTIEKWFFIDQTLTQLFDFYGERRKIGSSIAADAVAREREGYLASAGVIAHSRWAADNVIFGYGVPPEKVHVATPGASLDEAEYECWERERAKEPRRAPNRPEELRLVFVGKDWRRKGLDRLLAAFGLARKLGLRATLRVIGVARRAIPAKHRDYDGVEWAGFIDKRNHASEFINAVASCDLGCLLSRAEAGGIAFREYHALGLGALGSNVGGAAEHMIPEASLLMPPESSDEEIARALLALQREPERLLSMRRHAWERRRTALWRESISRLMTFWPHAPD